MVDAHLQNRMVKCVSSSADVIIAKSAKNYA
jgi:hypothetical protein